MSSFEIIAALLSFVYALSLTHLLQAVNDLVIGRDRVRFSLSHALWMLLALITLVNNWLALIPLRDAEWSTRMILLMFGLASVQYFTCSLVSPKGDGVNIDLAEYDRLHSVFYKLAYLAMIPLAIASNWIFWDEYFGGGSPDLLIFWPFGIVAVILTLSIAIRARWFQIVAAASLCALAALQLIAG